MTTNNIRPMLILAVVAAILGAVAVQVLLPLKEVQVEAIDTLIGAMLVSFTAIISFYFGKG